MQSIFIGLLAAIATAAALELYRWALRKKGGPNVSVLETLRTCARDAIIGFLLAEGLLIIYRVEKIHNSVEANRAHNELSRAVDTLKNAGGRSLFVRVAEPRLEMRRKDLQLIACGEVQLDSADEVTSVWLDLIQSTPRQIRATNVVSPAFWASHKNMGAMALKAHKVGIERNGVQIRRLYIVDTQAADQIAAVNKLASEYASIGVENRFIDIKVSENLDGYPDIIRAISTTDFVVFDDDVLLMVNVGSGHEVHSGRLSMQRESHVNPAIRCFDQWWDKAASSLDTVTDKPAKKQ